MLSGFRGLLYAFARILGDIQAVRRNRIGARIARRFAGSITARLLGRIFNR